jgi:hypothetical protein
LLTIYARLFSPRQVSRPLKYVPYYTYLGNLCGPLYIHHSLVDLAVADYVGRSTSTLLTVYRHSSPSALRATVSSISRWPFPALIPYHYTPANHCSSVLLLRPLPPQRCACSYGRPGSGRPPGEHSTLFVHRQRGVV